MSALWTKSRGAARSARLLLEAGDPDGAVNRAYYAMFGAARAALSTVRSALAHSKKHSTIVRRFDRHLVAERGFDRALGRGFLNRQRHARWVADYADASAEPPLELREDEARRETELKRQAARHRSSRQEEAAPAPADVHGPGEEFLADRRRLCDRVENTGVHLLVQARHADEERRAHFGEVVGYRVHRLGIGHGGSRVHHGEVAGHPPKL